MTNHNKTFSYILPMLGNSIDEFYNLVQPYVVDTTQPECDKHHIFLLTKTSTSDYFNRYIESLRKSPGYVSDYTSPDTKYIVTTHKVEHPEDIKNYDLFIQGKYSEMSEAYKKHIIRFHKLQPGGPMIGVLYKLEYRYKEVENKLNYHEDGTKLIQVTIPRTQEISDPPYIEKYETLNINTI